jgi:hypothetical protein
MSIQFKIECVCKDDTHLVLDPNFNCGCIYGIVP